MDVVLTADATSHSAYAELLAAPPPGVSYDARPLHWGRRLTSSAASDWARWKRFGVERALRGEPVPFPAPDWGKPVHAANVLLRTSRPWVVDYEHPWAFTSFDGPRLLRNVARLRAALADARLILPWTAAAARATRALLPGAAERIRVVPPSIAPRAPATPDPDAPTFLFVAKLFERKGGPEALEAFARVRRDHPSARLRMVTDAPPAVVERWSGRGVEFLPANQPRAALLARAYPDAVAYVMPTQFDTFGMVFLEAFAHALPVVTLAGFGIDEIVEDGRDGFVVEGYARKWFDADGLPRGGWEAARGWRSAAERERVVADLAAAMSALLADGSRCQAMGRTAHRKVTEGAFSLRARNEALLAAYREAFA